jgi:tRNA 2-selenouridine synthase
VIKRIAAPLFLQENDAGPILDVRAPNEYAHGHIPGAISFPLFTDEERAIVGTLYKHEGHDRAVLEGLRIFGPRMAEVSQQARKVLPGRKARLHCWRGGLRSGTMAWLLELSGIELTLLDHGYKEYRHAVLQAMEQPWPLLVLGGMTGSGKTDLLLRLREMGEQVLDLEGLASHKGSSFGGIGLAPQPSVEQFENNLAEALWQFDPTRRIWVEDESQNIGKVTVPRPFYVHKAACPVIEVQVSFETRVKKLAIEYCQTDPQLLTDAVLRIQKRLGGLATKQALEAIETGNMEDMVAIVLAYYDKAYRYQLEAREPGQIRTLPLAGINLQEDAQLLLEFANSSGF